MRKFAIIALFGSLFWSCEKEGPENADAVTVGFSVNAIDLDVCNTRAAVYIPNTRTVRIVVRKSVSTATAPDLARPIVAENTYYVNGNTMNLTECTIDPITLVKKSGSAGNGTAMTLPPGYYDIYAYSPAIPLDALDQTMTTVRNNMDFMATAAYGVKIEPGVGVRKTSVGLPAMQRLCTAICFADLYNEDGLYMKINSGYNAALGRPQGIFIENIYKEAKYVQGASDLAFPAGCAIGRQYLLNVHNEADVAVVQGTGANNTVNNPQTGGVTDYTRLGTGVNVGGNMVYNKQFYIMAGAANNPVAGNRFFLTFDFKFYSEFVPENGAALTPLITPLIDGTALRKGVKTSYNIKVESSDASKNLVVVSTIVPWGDGGTDEIYID